MPFNTMKKYLFPLSILLALQACEMDADIELPAIDPMLSATCFISPQDSVLTATVNRVNPLFGDEQDIPYVIDNATVTISNGLQSVSFTYDVNAFNYKLDPSLMPIESGQTYTMRIEAPGYPVWTASTTVPQDAVENVSAQVLSISSPQDEFQSNYNVEIEMAWDDVSVENSTYRGAVVYRDTLDFDGYQQIYNTEVVTFLEDDGETAQGRIRKIRTGNVYLPEVDNPNSFYFFLLHVNKDYYTFHKSLENMNYGSPFSEPTLVYTNASGGLGCFGAFQQTSVVVAP
jgi:hypothetical protein